MKFLYLLIITIFRILLIQKALALIRFNSPKSFFILFLKKLSPKKQIELQILYFISCRKTLKKKKNPKLKILKFFIIYRLY